MKNYKKFKLSDVSRACPESFRRVTYHVSPAFTLIELLVVIAIIALIIAVSLPNFLGARERSRDAKKKTELNQVKAALRLYYNDYGKYPAQGGGLSLLANILGCGTSGTTACPCNTSVDFAAGGAGCDNIYMKKLPTYSQTLQYKSDNADNYRISVVLENPSDPDIATSQARCPSALGASCTGNTYCVCPE